MLWIPMFMAIFVVTFSFVAVADSQSPGSRMAGDPRGAADREYREAQRLFEAGEYRRALRLFQRAQDAAPNAETLYSMARCYVELGRYARAAEAYESLVQNYPRYRDREGVEQAQSELRAMIADLKEGGDAPSRGLTASGGRNAYVTAGNITGGNIHIHVARDEEAEETVQRVRAVSGRRDVHVQATRMTRGRKISWSVLAGGLAITTIGAGLLIRGLVLHQEFEKSNTEWKSTDHELTEMAEKGENFYGAGWGLTLSGLAISCASILLFAFLPGKERILGGSGFRANVQLSLTGMSFAGSF
jgi:tetratricopeptide (TPR) repeat protein